MPQQDPSAAFYEPHAAEYDTRFAKAAAMRDALHLLSAITCGSQQLDRGDGDPPTEADVDVGPDRPFAGMVVAVVV